MELFLRRLKLEYVLEKPCPDAPSSEVATDEATLIKERIVKLQDDDYSGHAKICKFAKEIWDTLKAIYLAEEASSTKFLVSNYMEFKMIDDKSISEQVQEFQLIANKIALDENFHVGAIVSKLLPSWKKYRSKL
ncbi:hypothetical protein KY284_036424 [Solanum tuberosum]|nr:hypothetical protein KY284_036424 [Solanum tuberosum]